MRTIYETWVIGEYANPSHFEEKIFASFQLADQGNRQRLVEAFPHYFGGLPTDESLNKVLTMSTNSVQKTYMGILYKALERQWDDIFDLANMIAALDNIKEHYRVQAQTIVPPNEAERKIAAAKRDWRITETQKEIIQEYLIPVTEAIEYKNLEFNDLPEDLKEELLKLVKTTDQIIKLINPDADEN